MDDDGFEVQRRRRGYSSREPTRNRGRADFLREVANFEGTSEDFSTAHTRRYGREEGLGPDGSHQGVSYEFPRGTDRQRLYDQYNVSTRGRVHARNAYNREVTAAEREFDDMEDEEQRYYDENTSHFTPSQHERLDPRSKEYRDKCYSNATNREAFIRAHPHGYHTVNDQRHHHDLAGKSYAEYEYARDQQKRHEENRSYASVDTRIDQFGRPVPHRR